MVLEKTLESPLDSKKIKPVNSKGNQPWIFTGRSDAEAPILWPPDMKSRLTAKGLVAGKGWGQEEKGVHGITDSTDMSLSKLPGDSEGQGSLACCTPWGNKEWDTTEQLNDDTEKLLYYFSKVPATFSFHQPYDGSNSSKSSPTSVIVFFFIAL